MAKRVAIIDDQRVVPARLKQKRLEKHWKQADLCDALEKEGVKLSVSMVSAWEIGRKPVAPEYLPALTKCLDCEEDYLRGRDTENIDISDIHDANKYTCEIKYEDLCHYDGKPIYIEFRNWAHKDCWGIYCAADNFFHCIKYNITADKVLSNECRFYALAPIYTIQSGEKRKQLHSLDMPKFLSRQEIYVVMNTHDRSLRAEYNGWYHHNENHTAIINANGLCLPYEGLNLSYSAYEEMP